MRARGGGRLLKWLVLVAVGVLAVTALPVLLLRFVAPPTSAFMLEAALEARQTHERNYRTEYEWVDLEAISPNAALAVVASEDQLFPFHAGFDLKSNYFRLRLNPQITMALGMNVLAPGSESVAESVEIIGNHHPGALDMDAYERVLTDAMRGDATLFARQDYVEQAWRVVDPALKEDTPVFEYEPNTWGPKEVEGVTPLRGWNNSVVRTMEVVTKKDDPRKRKAV